MNRFRKYMALSTKNRTAGKKGSVGPYVSAAKGRMLGTRRCKYCHSRMPRGALKCQQCGTGSTFWQRHSGESFYALVIAIVSVLTLSFTHIREVFKADNSELVFSYVDSLDKNITLIASNKGRRPAYVQPYVILRVDARDKANLFVSGFFRFHPSNTDTNQLLVMDGSSILMRLQYDHDLFYRQGEVYNDKKPEGGITDPARLIRCEITVEHVEFSGKRRIESMTVFSRSSSQPQMTPYKTSLERLTDHKNAQRCLEKVPGLLVRPSVSDLVPGTTFDSTHGPSR